MISMVQQLENVLVEVMGEEPSIINSIIFNVDGNPIVEMVNKGTDSQMLSSILMSVIGRVEMLSKYAGKDMPDRIIMQGREGFMVIHNLGNDRYLFVETDEKISIGSLNILITRLAGRLSQSR